MNLPKDGRIIIVDDEFEKEAKPLIDTLSKHSIASLYFSGKKNELPDNPLVGIRLVFLDLDLPGMPKATGDKEKIMASYSASVLKKLISFNNGPYGIVFWSKHSQDNDVVELVLKNLKTAKIGPYFNLDLEKPNCKNAQGDFNINIISRKIQKKLKSISAFQIYSDWENLVHLSASNFIYELSSLFEFDEQWTEKSEILFFSLFKAIAGLRNIPKDNKLRLAFQLFNKSYLDVLQNETDKYRVRNNFKLSDHIINSNNDSRINSFLHITAKSISSPDTGCLYLEKPQSAKDKLINEIFKKYYTIKKRAEIRSCFLLITPACDIASNKFSFHLSTYGLLFTKSAVVRKKGITLPESLYEFGPFYFNGKDYWLVFNYQALTHFNQNELKRKPYLLLKTELTSDIQSKFSNYINRLGISKLG